jgi:beta-lactamase class A
MNSRIDKLISHIPGTFGWHYHNLVTDELYENNAHQPFLAASVIKLFVLKTIFQEIHEGRLDAQDTLRINEADKMPSCGALNHMHNGLEVTVRDLYSLMIILSDNTATNCLIRLTGLERINEVIEASNFQHTRINRRLFDSEAQRLGKENTFSPADVGILLESIYRRTFVSESFSAEAEAILMKQQLKNKIPALLPRHVPVAHKTGEDTGVTHDVGIVYARQPFVLCLAVNDTDVIEAEDAIRKIARICYQAQAVHPDT